MSVGIRWLRASRLNWVGFLLLLGGLFAQLGCQKESAVDRARNAGILLVGNGPEPESLDPHRSTSLSAFSIEMALYEGLVSPDPTNLQPLPAVAESWEVCEDGLLYRFQLRKSARWSDGSPVIAADFVVAWLRALDPSGGTDYAAFLYVIDGAEDYHRGDTAAEPAISALGEDVLEVRLRQPAPHFLHLLMHPICFPIPSHRPEVYPFGSERPVWSADMPFVGNGPFVLKDWQPAQRIEVSVSETYWDRETVRLKGIEFYFMDEPAVEERAFRAGQLHVTDSIPPARARHARSVGDPALCSDPFLATYYILPNHRTPVLADKRVRAALSLAIDRNALVERLLGGGERVARQFVPDSMPGYSGPGGIGPQDTERARQLLAEAGFPNGEGFPKLRYLFNSSENHRRIAEALQAMWKSVLGVDIELVNQEWRTYLQSRESGNFDLARAVWVGDYPEPSTFLQLWTTGHGNNWTGWSDTQYDTLVAEAIRSGDTTQRSARYKEAEARLIAESVVLPLYFYVTNYLKDPALGGWHPTILDWHPYKYLYFTN